MFCNGERVDRDLLMDGISDVSLGVMDGEVVMLDMNELIAGSGDPLEFRNSHGDAGVGSSYLSYSNCDVVTATL